MSFMRSTDGLKQKAVDYNTVGTTNYGPSILTWMYNGTGGSLAAGTAVAQLMDGSTQQVSEIGAMATANLDRLAGIVYPDAIAASAWGWVLTWGYCPAATVEGTTDITSSDSLKGVNAQIYLVKDTAPGTAPTYKRTAFALETYTTNSTASKKIMVECIPKYPA